jgi:hypothetical protein
MRPTAGINRVLLSISLKTRILLSFLMVILVLSVPIAVLGYRLVQKNIIRRAQRQVQDSINAAQLVYTGEIERMGEALKLVSPKGDIEARRDELNVHYLRRVAKADFGTLRREIAGAAVQQGKPVWGTRIITPAELATLPGEFPGKLPIEIKPTPRARPTDKKVLQSVMAKEYAAPLFDNGGQVQAVLYGGRVVNRDHTFVDRVREMVFGKEVYKDQATRSMAG